MKREITYQEDPAVTRRRTLGRAFFEMRRAERDEDKRKRRPRAKVKLEDRR